MSTPLQSLDGHISGISPSTASSSSQPLKPARVFACVLCQQRKVKCDRIVPCANCVRSRAQCVPGSVAPRQRTRRIPQRDLLERLRKYEDLLRQHNVAFEPLHTNLAKEKGSSHVESTLGSDDERPEPMHSEMPTPSTTVRSERRNVWHVMRHGYRDPDIDSTSSHEDELESAVNKAWDQSFTSNDNILFGTYDPAVDLSNLHPDPVQIFRLWQIYLDNVNPLLKVTHTPSLQGRIIEAASNISKISPVFEALMFSIYCTAISSLAADDCQRLFDSPREDLLMRYQHGCQQALLNCSFLRTNDRECLTALFLYLISLRPNTVPQSLSSMLAVAIRIAQRMGIHNESALARFTTLEAEMRRRLWWSLVLFDTRISEIANSKTVTLDPTWDCKIPLNVNDSDLRPEMKKSPAPQGSPTEALFAVVRCELGDVIRHSSFHLDFIAPALKTHANPLHGGGPDREETELAQLEEMIEDRYLKFCDPEHPLHLMTMWTTRAQLAKYRLLEHHSRHSTSPAARQTDAERDAATAHALRMLECDTTVMSSPLTRGFRWLSYCHFPFPAYIQIAQDLRRRPANNPHAPRAWDVMSDHYATWFGADFLQEDGPFFRLFADLILQAWAACEPGPARPDDVAAPPPRLVSSIRHTLSVMAPPARNADAATADLPSSPPGAGMDEELLLPPMPATSTPMPAMMGFSNRNPLHLGNRMPGDFTWPGPREYFSVPGQDTAMGGHMDPWDWMGLGGQPGWGGF